MRIYLRPVTPDDGERIVKWRNTEKVLDHSFSKNIITIESNAEFYRDNVVTGKYKQYIVERIDEEFGVCSYPIGTVYLKDLDHDNHRCELCVFASDDHEWNNDSQSIAIRMLLEIAFEDMKIHKVYTHVFASNDDEVSLMKRAGFFEEAVLREEACNLQGMFVDIVRLAITADQFVANGEPNDTPSEI